MLIQFTDLFGRAVPRVTWVHRVLSIGLALWLGCSLVWLSADPPDDSTTKVITKYGVPDASGVPRGRYLLAYDGRIRSARWVLERLDSRSLRKVVDRDTERFTGDESIPEEFRSTSVDYRGSGFDIGHLVPADTHRSSQSDLDATFLFSNATPQMPEFNRGLWKQLEAEIREIGETSPVWVVTCPLWVPTGGRLSVSTTGPHGVWIPSHCGKAILVERGGEIELKAWILPNQDLKGHATKEFVVSTNEFERAAGLDLWPALPDDIEKRLEEQR